MEKSERNVGVSDGPDNFGDMCSDGAAERAGGKSYARSAEQAHERLNFRVVPSIPTPEPPVPPLAAHFFLGRWPALILSATFLTTDTCRLTTFSSF